MERQNPHPADKRDIERHLQKATEDLIIGYLYETQHEKTDSKSQSIDISGLLFSQEGFLDSLKQLNPAISYPSDGVHFTILGVITKYAVPRIMEELKKKGLLKIESGGWSLTRVGLEKARQLQPPEESQQLP